MEDTISTLWIVMRGILGQLQLLAPLALGILNHGQSLVRLTVDIRSDVPPFIDQQCVGWFPRGCWERICASMTKLEFLCAPLPPVVADEHCTSRREHRDYLVTPLPPDQYIGITKRTFLGSSTPDSNTKNPHLKHMAVPSSHDSFPATLR